MNAELFRLHTESEAEQLSEIENHRLGFLLENGLGAGLECACAALR